MAPAPEQCPECLAPMDKLLADRHGGQFYRCRRSGFHWVLFEGSWYRDREWRRFAASRKFNRRSQVKEMRRSPLRRPDWRRTDRKKRRR